MAQSTLDLWPEDIEVSDLITPVAIMKEQASLLGQKTKNLVEAEVRTNSADRTFLHDFTLVAPALGHYRYKLFRVAHPVDIYPLSVRVEGTHVEDTVNSQDEFIEILRAILTSEKTKNVIKSLIAQSQN